MKKLLAVSLLSLSMGLSFSPVSQAATTQSQTKHPIVLVPGIFAFDSIATIDYWHKIPAALQSQGATVFVPKINAFDSSVKRGEALIAQLDNIRAGSAGKITKFNLMGHSQGGITVRYVMNTRPDLVASVTTMHTPHKGTRIADYFNGLLPADTLVGVAFTTFANTIGDIVNLLSNNKKSQADIRAMLTEFTAPGAAANNKTYPIGIPTTACGSGAATASIGGNSIRMYSWSGTGKLTNAADISDPLFNISRLAVPEENDGITGKCSSHFGTVLKDDYFMNHLDVTNQINGLVSLFETNPKTLFQSHASRLKSLNL